MRTLLNWFMPEKTLRGFASASKDVLKNEAIIAVMSASIVAPFIIPKINLLMESVPVLKDHKSIAEFLAGMAIFSIAGTLFPRNIIPRAIVIGIAGAFILSAFLPIYYNITAKNGGVP